jgi:hypothetical protein
MCLLCSAIFSYTIYWRHIFYSQLFCLWLNPQFPQRKYSCSRIYVIRYFCLPVSCLSLDLVTASRQCAKYYRWPTRCNNDNLLISKSAQHASGNHLPIFTSARLWFTSCGIVSYFCSRQEILRAATWHYVFCMKQHPSYRTHSTTLPLYEPPAYYNNTTLYHMMWITVLRSWRWVNDIPKHVELI